MNRLQRIYEWEIEGGGRAEESERGKPNQCQYLTHSAHIPHTSLSWLHYMHGGRIKCIRRPKAWPSQNDVMPKLTFISCQTINFRFVYTSVNLVSLYNRSDVEREFDISPLPLINTLIMSL